jgi:hypothetical protein
MIIGKKLGVEKNGAIILQNATGHMKLRGRRKLTMCGWFNPCSSRLKKIGQCDRETEQGSGVRGREGL